MSENKKKPRIQIDFFKGIIGLMLCLILYEINEIFNALSQITTGTESIFGSITSLAFLGIFLFPVWYWFVYPIILYSLDEAGIDLSETIDKYTSSTNIEVQKRIKVQGETKTTLILIFFALMGVFSIILVFLFSIFWFFQSPSVQEELFLILGIIIVVLLVISIVSLYFTKLEYEKYKILIGQDE